MTPQHIRRITALTMTAVLAAAVIQLSAQDPERPTAASRMRDHYAAILTTHESIIRGDLVGARNGLEALKAAEPPAGSKTTEPFISVIRAAGGRSARIRVLSDAATEAVRVLTQCGGCHAANGVQPNLPAIMTRRGTGLGAHMTEYMRGVDALFRGLVIPSNTDWRQGGARLATVNIPAQEWPDNPLLSDRRGAAPGRISYWAQRALSTTSPYGRANVYASVIEICGSCHMSYPNIWGPKRAGLP